MSYNDTTTRMDKLSEAKRALLQRRLSGKGTRPAPAVATDGLERIKPDALQRYEPFPLTEIQQAYWLGRSESFELGNIASHGYLELDCEDLDLARFERAWQQLVERHDMLRAVMLAGGRQQVLREVPPYRIATIDLRGQAHVAERLQALRDELSHQSLPTDRWPLFDLRAALLDGNRTRLYFSVDLLLMDASSMQIIGRDLYALYTDPSSLPPPPELTFRDYVLAERALVGTELHKRSSEYWKRRLPTMAPAPELPLRCAPGEIQQPRFVRRSATLPADAWLRLKEHAKAIRVSPSALVATMLGQVLARWSKHPRFTLNVTLFNRRPFHPQVNQLVGDFTSLTMLEVDAGGQRSFQERARRLQEQLWEDLDHSYMSGVAVLRELARTQGVRPYMPIVFTSTLTQDVDAGQAPGLHRFGRPVYNLSQTPQVWLDHQVSEQDGALVTHWDAVEDLFPAGLLDDMFQAYQDLARKLADRDDTWTSAQADVLPSRHAELVCQTNATDQAIAPGLLHTPIWERARQAPESLAVITPDKQLTHGELCSRAARVAHRLRAEGVQRGEPVAIVMDKSWTEIVAALGILAAGGAYVPLDASWPEERLLGLFAETEARIVLTQSHRMAALSWPDSVKPLAVDDEQTWAGFAEAMPEPVQQPEDLAYVIFTSGSTGKPKGVMIDHRGAHNTIVDINQRFQVSAYDRVLGLSAMTFDLSVYDVFGVLAAGGAVVLPAASERRDPAHWLELVRTHGVSLWNSVPALLQMLVEYVSGKGERLPDTLRVALLSGDWIPVHLPDRARALQPGLRLISLGGATEASIWSISYPIEEISPDWKSIPYGKPLANQRFHVLDEALQECPVWVPGHLHIAGIGLALGYWRDEHKTRASFYVHPQTGERLYKTGDLGRWLPDGTIEFLGREDTQVKVQGYRIELGEIETALSQHPAVRDAAVQAVGERHGSKQLVGYLVMHAEHTVEPEELRSFLRGKLPEYMVPVRFVRLEALPLSANGKVDRKALPHPDDTASTQAQAYVAPRNPLEERLAALWRELLQVDQLGVHDHFFLLGGDSLLGTQLIGRVREELGVELSLRMLFEAPTIAGMAEILATRETTAGSATSSELPRIEPDVVNRLEPFPLTPMQEAYWFGRYGGFELGNVATHFYLEIDGQDLDLERFENAWRALIDRHDALRIVLMADGRQRVLDSVPRYEIQVADVRGRSSAEIEAHLTSWRTELSHQILPIDRWPLFDLRATRIDDQRTRLHLSIDALLLDARSFLILLQELSALYTHPDVALSRLELSFRDYVLAERTLRTSAQYARARAYWRERLPGLAPAPELPLAVDPATVKHPIFVRRSATLEADVWERLKERATEAGLTPIGVLLAAYADVLAAWNKGPRFTLNVPSFNRLPLHPQVNDVIGDFASFTLVEVDRTIPGGFAARARHLQAQLWEALDHHAMSGVDVLRELARLRGHGSSASMPVVFTSQMNLEERGRSESFSSAIRSFGQALYAITQTSQVWLDHQAMEQDGVLMTNWDAVDQIFAPGTLDAMFNTYCGLLRRLAEDPEAWQRPSLELVPATQHAYLERKLPAHLSPTAMASPEQPQTMQGSTPEHTGSSGTEVQPHIEPEAQPESRQPAHGPARAASPDPLASRITEIVQRILQLGNVDQQASLLHLGASSVELVRIVNVLEDELGSRPPLEALFREPTIAALARFYRAQPGSGGAEISKQAAQPEPLPLRTSTAAPRMLLDPEQRESFKARQLGIRQDPGLAHVQLEAPIVDQRLREHYLRRRSHKAFAHEPIPLARFSAFLSCLQQIQIDGKPKYLYASGGGLYPVQTYVHTKPGRIEGLPAGIWYYHPIEHRLVSIAAHAEIPREVHYPNVNTPIFDEAAFSIFLIARMDAILPMYEERSMHYVLLEAGIMSHQLELSAADHGLGLSQIGLLDFERIRHLFQLDASDVYLHSLLGGLARPLGEASKEASSGAAVDKATRLLDRLRSLSPEQVQAMLQAQRGPGRNSRE